MYFSIACLSSPTAYKKLRELKPDSVTLKCLEYDTRFQVYGDDFLLYDYKEPLKFPKDWKNWFDLVIADPPFLSEECLCKTAVSIKYLAKDKIILCTGICIYFFIYNVYFIKAIFKSISKRYVLLMQIIK